MELIKASLVVIWFPGRSGATRATAS
jgi:hypothetical protein